MNAKVKEWIKLRKQGMSFRAIGDQYNVSKQAVYEALDKAGIKRKTKHTKDYPIWEKLYKTGESIYSIAKLYNCSASVVYNYLKWKVKGENQ